MPSTYEKTYITLFSIFSAILLTLLVANFFRALNGSAKEFSEFVKLNIRRKNDNVRDLVYYKVFQSPKFLVITRRDALLFVSVLILALYNYIGYIYTQNNSDLIASIVPFTMYGIFETAATHTKDTTPRQWSILMETFANVCFTMSTLLACEIIRGTFVMPLYVPVILIIVSVLLQFLSLVLKNRYQRNEMKQNADSGISATVKNELSKNDVESESQPANAKWTLDKRTYCVFTYIDIIIIMVPLIIVSLCYAFDVPNWQYSMISLFLIPVVYLGLTISLMVTSTGVQWRMVFSIFLSFTAFATILMVMLYSLGVFGHGNAEIAIGVPCFTLLLLFLVSIVFKHAQTVPLLSVSCVATEETYQSQCVGEVVTNVQNGESLTILHPGDSERSKLEGRL